MPNFDYVPSDRCNPTDADYLAAFNVDRAGFWWLVSAISTNGLTLPPPMPGPVPPGPDYWDLLVWIGRRISDLLPLVPPQPPPSSPGVIV